MEAFLRYWMRWPSVEHLIYRYLWVWGVCQSLHFVGMALLIGTVGILDLRLLGMAKQFPAAASALNDAIKAIQAARQQIITNPGSPEPQAPAIGG